MAPSIKSIVDALPAEKVAALSAQVAAAASAEDVIALAAAEGVEIGAEQAADLMAGVKARASEEIAIDELDNVAGGCHDVPCMTYGC